MGWLAKEEGVRWLRFFATIGIQVTLANMNECIVLFCCRKRIEDERNLVPQTVEKRGKTGG